MNHRALLVLFLAPATVSASTIVFGFERGVVDKIFAMARTSTSEGLGLASLERIAEGHPEAVDSRVAAQTGLESTTHGLEGFKTASMRAYSIIKIGATGLGQAVNYLSSLSPGIDSDESHQEWPAVQIALRDAQLRQIPDLQRQIEFLEKTTEEKTAAQSWAVDELCDRGSLISLPVVQQSIRSRDPSQRGEDDITFCEARMRLIMSDPDRTKVIGSLLQTGTNRPDTRMLRWAVSQLEEINTAEANQKLDDFAAQIKNLPPDSATHRELYYFQSEIEEIRNRAK
jgi:hypothetical protein